MDGQVNSNNWNAQGPAPQEPASRPDYVMEATLDRKWEENYRKRNRHSRKHDSYADVRKNHSRKKEVE